jgi:hypothetical protein
MATSIATPEARDARSERIERILVPALLLAGLAVRLFQAGYRFLNADEALHYLLSVQPSLAATYRGSLTTVHPPLLIVWLHYWGMLGHSELFLRLPCVIAGILFCWIVFLWLGRVTDSGTALIGITLLLFFPPMIQLSSEVRQYAFLLLLCAANLYFLERAILEESAAWMLAAGVVLWLALATHYSSLIFALTLGLYALLRLIGRRSRISVWVSWAATQVLALGLAVFFFVTHISKIRASGQAESIADSYLARSVLHPGQNFLWFIGRSNLRVFHYFFSQGAVGVVALILFMTGVVLLVRDRRLADARKPSGRQLAFLLVFPLVTNCAMALFRTYPYGGTRHNSYLVIFAMTGIAVAIARWKPPHNWWKPVIIVIVLVVCNLFPAPVDQYIRLHDQRRGLMMEAVAEVRSQPAESTIFTDDQGGLLLSYYLCGNRVAQIEQHPFEAYMRARCGDHWVISINPDDWIFKAASFPETFRGAVQTYDLHPGSRLLLFQAGWFIEKEHELRQEFKQYGCPAPHDFGRNMFTCTLRVP